MAYRDPAKLAAWKEAHREQQREYQRNYMRALRGTPARRHRRTRQQMEDLYDGLVRIVEQHQPVSVRQVYYLAVSDPVLRMPKSEQKGYEPVKEALVKLRRQGRVPYEHIRDDTIETLGSTGYGSLGDFVKNLTAWYERDLWATSPVRVQVWCEKLSLSALLADLVEPYRVTVHPTSGFTSETQVWQAANDLEDIILRDQEVRLLVLTDHDPSGLKIASNLEKRLLEMLEARGCASMIEVRRIAVTETQVTEWDLETRDPKTDPEDRNLHAKDYHWDWACELEAIHPERLRDLVTDAVEEYVEKDLQQAIREEEERERKTLQRMAKRYS